jgi:hypothetical protein
MDKPSNILTDKEACDALRLDDDCQTEVFAGDNASATAYIDNATGTDWEKQNPIDPLAKACAKLKLQQNFYHDADHDFQDRIVEYLCLLKAKAARSGS